MPDEVRCANCGFLAVIHRTTRNLLSAERQLRDDGYLLDTDPITGSTAYEANPVCFVNKLDFRKGFGSAMQQEHLRASLQEGRQCDGYTPWTAGLTPKEHWEMIQEEARLKWQA